MSLFNVVACVLVGLALPVGVFLAAMIGLAGRDALERRARLRAARERARTTMAPEWFGYVEQQRAARELRERDR